MKGVHGPDGALVEVVARALAENLAENLARKLAQQNTVRCPSR